VEQKQKTIHYIKLHIPWNTLSANAEYLQLRAPLQVGTKNFVKFMKISNTKISSRHVESYKAGTLDVKSGNINVKNVKTWQKLRNCTRCIKTLLVLCSNHTPNTILHS